jgi:hypothetical protein
MKLKVKELDWYADFSSIMHQIPIEEDEEPLTPEECYDYELLAYAKEGRDYDGPLRYIERCDDPGFPKREGLLFCIRLRSKKNEYWKKYQCWCYQLGSWWRFKKPMDTVNSYFYVPQFISEYDYDNIKIPNRRILNDKAKNDIDHHRHQKELRQISRSTAKWRLQVLKD